MENRAKIREPATLVILNATRLDTASYRCEVTAPSDIKNFDEILISLAIRGARPFTITGIHTPCMQVGITRSDSTKCVEYKDVQRENIVNTSAGMSTGQSL